MKPRFEQPGVPDGTTFSCFIRRQESFDFAWHFHREYELTLITEGSGTRYVGTTVERYEPGDLVLLGPDLPHTFASEPYEGMAEAAVAQFRHDFLGPDFFGLPQFRPLAGLLAHSVRGLHFGRVSGEVARLLADLPRLPPAAQTVALLTALQHLTSDATATAITGPGYAPAPSPAVRERIDAVCRHLRQTHTQPVDQTAVAALVHMSPTSFSRFFRRAMGRTLTDYVNQLRIETACTLLTDTALPVTEVATRSGYQNLSNFNRRFKELKGLRPTQYRASHLGRSADEVVEGDGAVAPAGQ
ncbi:AraC family transcriptional regulator [Streptomyces boninensis]|uniref:AraC family transcriptional regulator n=1 Tax=Streptomyces boninensis TaxID=2039455 RepID=UPI003B21F3F9